MHRRIVSSSIVLGSLVVLSACTSRDAGTSTVSATKPTPGNRDAAREHPPVSRTPTRTATSESPPASPAAGAIDVQLTIEAMHAAKTTDDEDRDEVYLVVWTENHQARLPSQDDYYEGYRGHHLQNDGWTNKDQAKLGMPVLWSGRLQPAEQRTLYTLVCEQDRGDFPLSKYWPEVFAAKPIDPLVPAIQAIHNRGHQVIGAFQITILNKDGHVKIVSSSQRPATDPIGDDTGFGPNAMRWVGRMSGGCEYHFVARVRGP